MRHADIAIGNAVVAVLFTVLFAPIVLQAWPWDFAGREKKARRKPT